MRIDLKPLLIIGLLTPAMGVNSFAADLPDEVAADPIPVVEASEYDWSGAYIGINLGAGFAGDFDNTAGLDLDADAGFLVGGVIGYNYKINKFVLGAEVDTNYTSIDASSAGVEADLNFLGTVTGRLGFTPRDRLLTYVEGGYAFGGVDVSTPTASDSNFHSGFVVGAGAEYAVTDNILSGFEYNYIDLQDEDFDLGAAAPEADFSGHTVKFNLKYKF